MKKIPFLNQMRYLVDILAGDGSTPLLLGIKAAIEDAVFSRGGQEKFDQGDASVSTHIFTVRANALITSSCYVQWNNELFIVNYLADPGVPLRGRYTQIYARRVNDGIPAPSEYDVDGGTF